MMHSQLICLRMNSGAGLKAAVLSVLMSCGVAISFADACVAAPLESRKLMVFALAPNDKDLERQIDMVAREKAGVSDRDIVLEKIIGTDAQSARLRRKFGVSHSFHVLLLGRDGHVAVSSDHPLVPRQLFKVIDSMPMRQEEMRENYSSHTH